MKIYNSQTRQKEEFVPIEPGKVCTTTSTSATRARS